MKEENKFLNWFESELKRGLQDLHFFVKPGHVFKNKEDVFKSMNNVIEASKNANVIKKFKDVKPKKSNLFI